MPLDDTFEPSDGDLLACAIDDMETMRTTALRKTRRAMELLDKALHATRDNNKDVADEMIDRANVILNDIASYLSTD